MTTTVEARMLLTRDRRLEWATPGWNLAGFGLDSLIEIGVAFPALAVCGPRHGSPRSTGVLAVAVPLGLLLNATADWWWPDPAAGPVIVGYAVREAATVLREP